MILQALEQYYYSKTSGNGHDAVLPPWGYEANKIGFVVEVDLNGKPIQIRDVRHIEGRKKTGKVEWVPKTCDRTGTNSWQTSFLLWDHPRYSLGVSKKDEKTYELAIKRFHTFIEFIRQFYLKLEKDDEGVLAVLRFLDNFDSTWLNSHVLFDEICTTNTGVAYMLRGDSYLVCQRPKVKALVIKDFLKSCIGNKTCLVSGETASISQLHPATSIKDAKATAKIVSFNEDAYYSYVVNRTSAKKKIQSKNAPVGEKATFAYTTALNHLLRKGSDQRIQVGDASTVFWAEKTDSLEHNFQTIWGATPKSIKDDPDKYTEAVRSVLNAVNRGSLSVDQQNNRFYVLGLAPNAARIAIRFWIVGTVAEISQRTSQYFEELQIVHADHEPDFLPLFRLLVNIATQSKSENIPPNLAGNVMQSILTGRSYPYTLLASAIRRNKAEQSVNYPRAAVIKAYLNRMQSTEEIKVSLDKDNNTAYRLGRLFAVLEKIQEKANPGINATIRDRYYSAASANPVSVFATLLKLKNHHLAKLESAGLKIYFERLLGEIFSEIAADLPSNLTLQDQGRFAVGYYHQRQAFFTKPNNHQGETK